MARNKTLNAADASNVVSVPSSISININRATWKGALVKLASWILLFATIAFLCIYVVREMTEPNPEIDESRKKVARAGILRMIADIRYHTEIRYHTDDEGPKKIAVVHFSNDPSDFVTETVRYAAGKQGGFSVVKSSFADRFCKMVGRVNEGVSTREQAIHETQGDGVDGVLWGRVNRLENERDGATFTGDYELYDLRREQPVYSGKIRQSTVPGRFEAAQNMPRTAGNYLISLDSHVSGMPWYIRFLLFVVAVLLLPVVTISFIRTMVAKKSNGINAFVLGIYTTVDLILAFFMVGGSLSSFFYVVVFLLAGVLAFLYNVKIMTFAVRLGE